MKRRMLRVLSLCLLLVLVVAAMPALAEKAKVLPGTLYLGGMGSQVYVENVPSNAKLVSIKSSESKVLEADQMGYTISDMAVFPRAIGKSKVTVKYKVGKKTYTISGTFAVKKFPKIFSSIKVNGKPLAGANTVDSFSFEGYKKNRAKISFKVKSPWKLLHTELQIPEADQFTSIVNGKSFKIPKGKDAQVAIYLRNSKTEDDIIIWINFLR